MMKRLVDSIEAGFAAGTFNKSALKKWHDRLVEKSEKAEDFAVLDRLLSLEVQVLRAMSECFPTLPLFVDSVDVPEGAKPEKVDEYRKALRASTPPPVVVRRGVVIDGRHRLAAAKLENWKRIPAVFPWGV